MNLEELLKFVTEKGASDLHLKPTRPPMLRINGRLMPIEAEPLKPEKIREMILPILTPQQKAKLEETQSVDLGYGVRGLARFRGNIYMQRGTLAAVVADLTLHPVDLDPALFRHALPSSRNRSTGSRSS